MDMLMLALIIMLTGLFFYATLRWENRDEPSLKERELINKQDELLKKIRVLEKENKKDEK